MWILCFSCQHNKPCQNLYLYLPLRTPLSWLMQLTHPVVLQHNHSKHCWCWGSFHGNRWLLHLFYRMESGAGPLPLGGPRVAVVTRSPWQPDTTAVGRVCACVCWLDSETWYSLPLLSALKVIHVDIDHLFLLHLLQRPRLNALLYLSPSLMVSICFSSVCGALYALQLTRRWPSFQLIYSGLT